jgi:predicted nucleic acid-binding protein
MKAFVLDVSACMPWCCEDEATPGVGKPTRLGDGGRRALRALALGWELLNAMGAAVKRRRISNERGKEFLEQFATLNLKIDQPPHVRDFPRLHELATRHQLTSYDVAYLDLAKRLSMPLATRNADLGRAAVSEGIEVFGK